MDVLVKGMKMPSSCGNCKCNILDILGWRYCCIRGAEIENNPTRPEWCPLVEVPPHGRLIDADSFKRDLKLYTMIGKARKIVEMNLDLTETVIEAEE